VPHNMLLYAVMVMAVVVAVRRNLRSRNLKVDRMWLVPIVGVVVGVAVIASAPPTSLTAAGAMAAGLILGGLVGWQRARLTHIAFDPESKTFTSQTSPIGILMLLAVLVARTGLRLWLASHPAKAGVLIGATDALILFAVAMVVAQRIEMWLRCRKLRAPSAQNS
jgi:membrane protein CcdC involved in cytochrome C biogenesis